MKKGTKVLILVLIFIATLGFRLLFAFQTPYFSGDTAYFNLRQIESIRDTGKPLFHDSLSYGGRDTVFTPLFHYILAFFSLFIPITQVAKILPNIFASCLIIISFLIAKEITKSDNASLFVAFVTGFIPVFISYTVNSISVYTLTVPLMFYLCYCFMNLNKKKYIYQFIILIFVLPFIHMITIVLIIGLLFYLFLVRLELMKQARAEIELITFSLVLVVWLAFLIFKKAFLIHGPLVWKDIPLQIINQYFSETSIAHGISYIGIIPTVLGVYIIYKLLFVQKNRLSYLLIGFASSITLLLWLKLILPAVGLSLLGIVLAIFSGIFYSMFSKFIENTNFGRYKQLMLIAIIILFIVTSIVPSIIFSRDAISQAPNQDEINALRWLRINTEKDAVVLSTLKEGHWITALAKRSNVIDSNFLLVKDANTRVKDIETIYSTIFETEAIKLLNKYYVRYIYFSGRAREAFGKDLSYAEDKECFELVYNETVKIYKAFCSLEEKSKQKI